MKYTRGTRGNEEKEFVIRKAFDGIWRIGGIFPDTLAQPVVEPPTASVIAQDFAEWAGGSPFLLRKGFFVASEETYGLVFFVHMRVDRYPKNGPKKQIANGIKYFNDFEERLGLNGAATSVRNIGKNGCPDYLTLGSLDILRFVRVKRTKVRGRGKPLLALCLCDSASPPSFLPLSLTLLPAPASPALLHHRAGTMEFPTAISD
ncbi:MAG: hypothetical protein Q9215_002619 [Flavoplaca cf. flavocitrina]